MSPAGARAVRPTPGCQGMRSLQFLQQLAGRVGQAGFFRLTQDRPRFLHRLLRRQQAGQAQKRLGISGLDRALVPQSRDRRVGPRQRAGRLGIGPGVVHRRDRRRRVGVAALSYGVALVCFAIAVMYLLKDKVKTEAMAIWSSLFGIAVFATISKFSVFTEFVYRIGTFMPNPTPGAKPFSSPFRLEIPYVGAVLAFAGILLFGVIVSFLIYLYQQNEGAKKAGHILLKLSLVVQLAAIAFYVSGVRTVTDVPSELKAQLATNPTQYVVAGRAIAEKENLSAQEFAALTPAQLDQAAKNYLVQRGDSLFLSLKTNPVEFVGLITALAGTFFVILFSFRTEKLRERLPSLDALDGLMYKTASLAFAGLAMLLITGAIWANESWGRPWGFDSKETAALIAWLTYAAFLHTRISRGWSGRSSAYFAIVGFMLVIFTYLGVSYLLPGLHSYA